MSIRELVHRQELGRFMVDAQLSLAPPSIKSGVYRGAGICVQKKSRGALGDMPKAFEEEGNYKKRKMNSHEWGHDHISVQKSGGANPGIGVELQMKTPLPLEWEQCLDLQSGRIYYVNRRTQLRTCQDPRGQLSKDLRLDLELNFPVKNEAKSFEPPTSDINSSNPFLDKENMNERVEMVATVCAQCHMFVMFSKASRQCPHCKYVHPLMDQEKKDSINCGPGRQTLTLIDCGLQSKNNSKQGEEE